MKTLDEVPTITVHEKDLLQSVKCVIHRFLPGATVLLYGSVARGTQGPESDYDILVLTDEPLSRPQEAVVDDAVYDVELSSGVAISTIFYSKQQWDRPFFRGMPLHREVERDGVLL